PQLNRRSLDAYVTFDNYGNGRPTCHSKSLISERSNSYAAVFSVTDEEESTRRTYILLEGDDGKVHFICHIPAILQARHAGQLAPNSNVTVSKRVYTSRRHKIRA